MRCFKKTFKYVRLICNPEVKLLEVFFWKFALDNFLNKPWPLQREKYYFTIYVLSISIKFMKL